MKLIRVVLPSLVRLRAMKECLERSPGSPGTKELLSVTPDSGRDAGLGEPGNTGVIEEETIIQSKVSVESGRCGST